MIKQLQMGFKLLRYTHGTKTCIGCGALTLLVGMAIELCGSQTMSGVSFAAGGYFVLITAMWPLQLLISMNVPEVVVTSPWKKRIQTSVFAISAAVYFLVAYVLVLGLKFINYHRGILTVEALTTQILELALLTFVVVIYMAFSLKYFVASTAVFCFVMPTVMTGSSILHYTGWIAQSGITPGIAVVIGFLSVFISTALAYGILCLIYKKPVSKYSQMNSLKKKM